jgi:hypothetical protein
LACQLAGAAKREVQNMKNDLWIITVHSRELSVEEWRSLKEFLCRKKIRHYAAKLPFKGELRCKT